MSPALAGRFFPAEPLGKPINERQDIIYLPYRKNILSEYYEQLYNKLDNLEEMNKFLERHKLPKKKKKEMENLNM